MKSTFGARLRIGPKWIEDATPVTSSGSFPLQQVKHQELADEEEAERDPAGSHNNLTTSPNITIDTGLLPDKQNMHEETSAKRRHLGFTASPNREIDTVLLTEKEIAHQELDTTEKETTIKDERLEEITKLSSRKFDTELIAVKMISYQRQMLPIRN